MKKVYYFAYGSNLLIDRLQFRVGKVQIRGTYRLNGWKLVFNTSMGYRYSSTFANIVKGEENDFVEGVLYDMTPAQIKELSRFEGLYEEYFFDLPDGSLALVYISTDPFYISENRPDIYYINFIIEGCLKHGLIHTYNKLVLYKKEKMRVRSKHKIIPIDKIS